MDIIFDGKYKILRTVGNGGMSTVYLAEKISDGTYWAIKAVPKTNAESFDLLAEPKILLRLNHPALPKIADVVQDRDYLYIVENYIEGVSVDKQLEGHQCFDEVTVVEWAKQLCDVLIYLHNQHPPIIYRDMKPSNILVSQSGRISVIDFGIAREYRIGGDNNTMGTKGYAAPEQYSFSQTDPRTDIYSLGVTMHHMLTGKSPSEPPYGFENLRRLKPGLSEGIEYIVNKCTRINPGERFSSAIELKHELENIYSYNHEYKKYSIKRKGKMIIRIMLAAVFVAMILVSFLVISDEQENSELIEQGRTAVQLYEFDDKRVENDNSSGKYLKNASQMLKEGRYTECIDYLSKIKGMLTDADNNSEYMYLMGTAYFDLGDFSSAAAYFAAASDIEPDNKMFSRNAAVSYAKAGDLKKADELLRGLMDTYGDDASTYYIAGRIYLEKNDYAKAIDCYELALVDTTEYELKVNTYKGIAEAYVKSKDYEKAIECYNKLLDIGCDPPYIYRNLAIMYQMLGDTDKEEEILRSMQSKYPEDYQCYLMLAYMHMEIERSKPKEERDYNAVLDNYRKAVEYAPTGEDSEDLIPLREDLEALGKLEDKK